MNKKILEYQRYIRENGLPFLDYKIHRSKSFNIKPKTKFRNGIKRITRIVKSYKIDDLQGLLMAHRRKLQDEKAKAEMIKRDPIRPDKSPALLGIPNELTETKVDMILDFITKQSDQIDELQNEVRKLRLGIYPKVTDKMIKRKTNESLSSESSSLSSGDDLKKDSSEMQNPMFQNEIKKKLSTNLKKEDLIDGRNTLEKEETKNPGISRSNTKKGLSFGNFSSQQ